jgi:hypothetical protein
MDLPKIELPVVDIEYDEDKKLHKYLDTSLAEMIIVLGAVFLLLCLIFIYFRSNGLRLGNLFESLNKSMYYKPKKRIKLPGGKSFAIRPNQAVDKIVIKS